MNSKMFFMKRSLRPQLFVFGLLLIMAFLSPVTGAEPGGDVIAFTAASLTGASGELEPAFESEHPGYAVTWNLAGTQELRTQVVNGANADVFISASPRYTTELKNGGYFINDTVTDLVTNWITVIVPAANHGEITTLADLAKPGIMIAMGTEEVPVGINTRKVIDKMANQSEYGSEWKDAVYANTVTYEVTEPSVVEKVKLGEVDAGFVYQSSSSAAGDSVQILNIPEEMNEIQYYHIAILKDVKNPEGAAAFTEFMTGAGGQGILEEFGFTPAS